MAALKDDLVNSVQARLKTSGIELSKKDVDQIVNAVFDGLLDTIKDKESVRTSIGTFRWIHTEERQRRNPRTGDQITVPAYYNLKFSVGKQVRVYDADLKVAKKPAAKAAPKVAPKAVAGVAKAAPAKVAPKVAPKVVKK